MKFRVKDVPGSGNCLFEAVGRSADISASDLRQKTVDWMRLPNQHLHGENLSMWIQNGAPEIVQGADPIDSYTKYMQRSGTWGGGIELAVLATMLHRPILVYASESREPNVASRIAEFLPDASQDQLNMLPAICILYVGRAHYMQLVAD